MFVGAASKFRFRVAFPIAALMATVFIGVVQTVVVSIADVDARDAVAIVASKQVSETGLGPRFAVIRWLISSCKKNIFKDVKTNFK